jgi:hypothetical protein
LHSGGRFRIPRIVGAIGIEFISAVRAEIRPLLVRFSAVGTVHKTPHHFSTFTPTAILLRKKSLSPRGKAARDFSFSNAPVSRLSAKGNRNSRAIKTKDFAFVLIFYHIMGSMSRLFRFPFPEYVDFAE